MADVDLRPVVLLDGQAVESITLASAVIRYGATQPGQPPEPATAFLELLTVDAVPAIADEFPGMGWGSSIPSGFDDTYQDAYEGGGARIQLGTPVAIQVSAPTGFTDHYAADYAAGYDSTRLRGQVAAIDYRPGSVALTVITAAEQLTRRMVLDASWPAEPETSRVARIAAAAGVQVDLEGTSTQTIAPGPADLSPKPAWTLLQQLAKDCGALLYGNREGRVIYRTRSYPDTASPLTLYPGAVGLDSLALSQELGLIVNTATVRYTGPDGQPAELTETAPASIARWGIRAQDYTVNLEESGAREYAQRQLALWSEPAWWLPTVEVAAWLYGSAGGTYPANLVALCELDLDATVYLPQLLPGSPVPDYSSRVLGWTEYLDARTWRLALALDPHGWTQRAPDDGSYVPPPVVGPSANPSLEPGTALGEFRIRNYDAQLTYTASPLAGTTATATLDAARGVYTVSAAPAAFSVATTEPDSKPGYMERKPYTFSQQDQGRWESYTVTVDESYPARAETQDILGDPPVNGQCPPGWYPVLGPGGAPRCQTQVVTWYCDYGGELTGTTCRKVYQRTEQRWVPNLVTVKDATPQGYTDTGQEWVRTR